MRESVVEDDLVVNTENNVTRDEVFEDDFQSQQRRGFLNGGGGGGGRQEGIGGRGSGGQTGGGGRGGHQEGTGGRGSGGQPVNGRERKQTWRQKLPNITGNSGDKGFAAPIDLFVFNVNNEVTEDAIKNHMKDSKALELIEVVKVSHNDARTKSFRVKVKSEDYEKAMDCETWPSRVRVRPYRHFKQRREQTGGQFGEQDRDGHGQQAETVGHGGGNNSQA